MLTGAVVLALALPAASDARPKRVHFFSSVTALIPASLPKSSLRVRPSTIFLANDGHWALIRLQWTGWGSRVARGEGISSVSNGIPNNAEGERNESPASITLSRRTRIRGRRVYRCFHLSVEPPATSYGGCLKRVASSYLFL